jgi:hypothetical protein
MLSVMTMESQAEALGQLGADDLEGKVIGHWYILLMIFLFVTRSDHCIYLWAVRNAWDYISWWRSCTIEKRTVWELFGMCAFFGLKP